LFEVEHNHFAAFFDSAGKRGSNSVSVKILK
jgi:hypothetical protein